MSNAIVPGQVVANRQNHLACFSIGADYIDYV